MSNIYRFVHVEDYFSYFETWNKLETVSSSQYDPNLKCLYLFFDQQDAKRTLVIQFGSHCMFRVRFHPNKKSTEYSQHNNHAIVLDTFENLQKQLGMENVQVQHQDNQTEIKLTVFRTNEIFMKVVVNKNPFRIKVFNKDDIVVWSTPDAPIYFKATDENEFDVIQTVNHPPTAKYIGFGEQGGRTLVKNTNQLTYFNYDNMRYRTIYGKGPFEEREPLYHTDPVFYGFNSDPKVKSIYGIYIDNPSQINIDLALLDSTKYMFGTRFRGLEYYFILGAQFAEVIETYTAIMGRPKLKPRWALGYHQGCFGYESGQRLLDVVKGYRDCGIPIDGLHVDVDLQQQFKTFTVNEKFPKDTFTQLRKQGIKCSTNITPIISNQDPHYPVFIDGVQKDYFIKDIRVGESNANPNWYEGQVDYGGNMGTTGHYPDLARVEVQAWWGEQYKGLLEHGIEMIWQDMTTPAIAEKKGDMKGFPFKLKLTDNWERNNLQQTAALKVWNLYSYNLHKATYNGLNKLNGNKRNFIIGRGSFSGMHRFAALWTGDNASTWEFLQINVAQVISLGMCGMSICGQDIGGFEPAYDREEWPDPELLIRWTIVGALMPWFRNHYNGKQLEGMKKKKFQEPYEYSKISGNFYDCVVPVCRHYIQLRYRLMQLLYDAQFENVVNGLPVCRSMVLTDPSDPALLNDKHIFLDNQFLVRNDLLVAPILEPQTSTNAGGSRDIYLPTPCKWFQFMDNRKPLLVPFPGGRTINDFKADITKEEGHLGFILPMFVREGAVIPTVELELWVGQKREDNKPNPITFNIYPGESGSYTTYLDDGESRDSAPPNLPQYQYKADDEKAQGLYRETKITHRRNLDTRTITFQRIHDQYTPLENFFFVALLHEPSDVHGNVRPVDSIQINQQEVPCIIIGGPSARADALWLLDSNGWYYNENVNITFIKVFDKVDITIEVKYHS